MLLSKKKEREIQRCADNMITSIEKYKRAQQKQREKSKLEKASSFGKDKRARGLWEKY